VRRRVRSDLVGLALLVTGCTQWQRVGSEEPTRPEAAVPQLFDASVAYREMGFLVAGPQLPFVGSVRYLATAGPDSTLCVLSLSLANQALSFRRAGNLFVAEYRVELAFRRPDSTAASVQVTRDETVRVGGFRETLRSDESVLFQQFVAVAPGDYVVSVLVRDRNTPRFGRQDQTQKVPRFATAGLSSPLPVYEGTGRRLLSELPRVLLNPRATLPYGGDSLRFYVEAYGVASGTRIAARAVDPAETVVWRDTVTLSGSGPLASAVLVLAPSQMPLGRANLKVEIVGRPDTAVAPLLVSLSDQWVITNLEQMASLLRYFERQDWVAKLRDAPPAERSQVWRDFWKETDPMPITPENEALAAYFRRVQLASTRFQEEGGPGWLTDRGEVFITLGEPDEVLDLGSDMNQGAARVIRWTYNTDRLVLVFQDQTGFGRFRLVPASRAEYQRVLARVRRKE